MAVEIDPELSGSVTFRVSPLQKKKLHFIANRIGIAYSDWLRMEIESTYEKALLIEKLLEIKKEELKKITIDNGQGGGVIT